MSKMASYLLLISFIILISVKLGRTELSDFRNENNFNLDLHTREDNFNDLKALGNFLHIKDMLKTISNFKPKIVNLFGGKKKGSDWWQTDFIYQIYPRSFKDSNGDGIGDIQGIIEKIPYLKSLGVSSIWINPIYPSPGVDLGYDVSDFISIDPIFGTMSDFEELIQTLHKNGIKLLMDFIPNHTSDKHDWFVKSVRKIKPYTDYYVWADAKYVNGTRQPPNNWTYVGGGTESMWEWNAQRKQYYLHQFFAQMPDLNFWCPSLRDEIKDVLRFWLDLGVDGFRIDAVPHLYERADLKDAPPETVSVDGRLQVYGYTQCLDETYDEVVEWRTVLDEYKQRDGQTRLIVVESYNPIEYMMRFYGTPKRPGAHYPLNSYLLWLPNKSAKSYIELIKYYMGHKPEDGWPSWMIGCHDTARSTSRYGEEIIDGIRMLQFLLPGTPINYMGDELGMQNTYLRDDQVHSKGFITDGVVQIREQSRTPFQWDSSAQAGFSNKTKPWLPVNPNYVTVNVQYEQNAQRSHLKVFKEIVKMRQREEFRYGDLNLYEISDYVFAFSRSSGWFKTYFVVINVGSEFENVDLFMVKKLLPPKLTVRIASVYAEQNIGDVIKPHSFTLRPKAALVIESSFFNI